MKQEGEQDARLDDLRRENIYYMERREHLLKFKNPKFWFFGFFNISVTPIIADKTLAVLSQISKICPRLFLDRTTLTQRAYSLLNPVSITILTLCVTMRLGMCGPGAPERRYFASKPSGDAGLFVAKKSCSKAAVYCQGVQSCMLKLRDSSQICASLRSRTTPSIWILEWYPFSSDELLTIHSIIRVHGRSLSCFQPVSSYFWPLYIYTTGMEILFLIHVQYDLVKWQFFERESIIREKVVREQDGRLHANLSGLERICWKRGRHICTFIHEATQPVCLTREDCSREPKEPFVLEEIIVDVVV